MENIRGFISSELRLPNESSSRKKRYVTFKCHKCGEVVEKVYLASKFIDECSSCSRGAFTTEEFILRSRRKFGNKYDYSLTKYKNKRTRISIICPVHGEFTQRAQEHLEGHGCRKCATDQRALDQQLSIEEWENRLKNFPKISFSEKPSKLGYHTKVKFKCEDHGIFEAALGRLLEAVHICRKCGHFAHQIQSVRDNLIGTTAYLYFIYLPEIGYYKLGVTTNKRNRFRALGEAIEMLIVPMEYTQAISLEHKLLSDLEEYRYKGEDVLLPNGNTELITENVYPKIKRALQEQSCIESYLNGRYPTK